MKSMLSVSLSLKLLLVLFTGQVSLHASQSAKKWQVDEIVEESHAGFFEGGKAWGFKDYTKKPTAFEALKKRILSSQAQREIDANLPQKTKPKRSCGLDDVLKRVKALYYGQHAFTLERFFTELKHPTKDSVEHFRKALFEDKELWYAVDKETGLSPLGIIITSYPHATADEKEEYKRIFKYMLPNIEQEWCFVDLESPQPFDLEDAQVSDLREIFVRYVSEDHWQDIVERLRSRPDTKTRLDSVAVELYVSNFLASKKKEQPLVFPPQKEQVSGLSPVLWLIGAAAVYGVFHYLTGTDSSTKREQASDYGRLFAGGVK